jgi:AcrR family transcriptional regulator
MARNQQRSEAMREQSRGAILAAALEVFGESGFAQSTTAEIAEKAGVSKGLVFNYFPSKDALLQALVEKMLGEALDFWDAQPWQGTPREQLLTWVDTAIAQVLRRPGFYRLYFSLALQPGGSGAVERALRNLEERLTRYLQRAEQLLQAAGSNQPALDARLLQCAINGLAQVIVTSPSFTSEAGLVAVAPLRERLTALIGTYCPEREGR